MKLLLADDHPIFRKGLKALILDFLPDASIDEAEHGQMAMDQITSTQYDLAILDIDMPGASGIEVLRFLRSKNPDTRAIILTMHNDELFFNEAFDHGASGFLLKEDSSLEMVECIRAIREGEIFVSEKLANFLKNRKHFTSRLNVIKEALRSLSNTEYATLKLVALNKTSKEISELLFVTEKSVENYRSRICKKLDLTGGSNTLFKWTMENRDLIMQSDPGH
jgi:DNA-binding NarL/FixJ family response regulator